MSGKGGYLHDNVLLASVEACGCSRGAVTRTQVHAGAGKEAGHIDLVMDWPNRSIAVEAELSSKRIGRDVLKAMNLGADELWILVPNSRIARAIHRKLKTMLIRLDQAGIFVLTLPQAVQRLSIIFPPIFEADEETENKPAPENK